MSEAPWAAFTPGASSFSPGPARAASGDLVTEPPWKPFMPVPLGVAAHVSPRVQRKAAPGALSVSSPSDPAEREADVVAAEVLAHPGRAAPHALATGAAGDTIDRKCQSCEDEQDEHGEKGEQGDKENKVHRRGEGPGAVTPAAAEALRSLGAGAPLPPSERSFFEPRLGHELSGVRVHAYPGAARAARELRAEAFTLRNDVAFAEGRYQPGSARGRELLAHELVHVIQQGGASPLPGAAAPGVAAAPPRIARRTDDTPTPPDEGSALGAAVGPTATPAPGAAPAASPAPAATPATDAMPASVAGAGGGLIVEDDAAALTAGQMRKSAFLAELRAEACAAADRELARAGRDTRGCPQVERLITMYAGRPAAHLERAVRKYAPGASAASAARAYIPVVAMRIAHGVATFVQTGRLPDDIPPDLQAEAAGSLGGGIGRAIGGFFSSVAGAIGGAFSAVGKLLFKGAPGGARSGVDEGALAARLGAGRPLEGGTRHRMESAFGRSFDRVRVHDDAAAAGMSRDLNARAFTLGQHVAFSDGDYRPGTPVGDAILAHELAHVGQQGDGVAPSARGGDAAPFEHDAERAAGDAVAFLYGGGGRPRASIGAAGGLGLRRCAATDGPFHSMSLNAYIARWEKEHHQTMSDEQKNILTRGCIGITALNLNEGNVMPPLDMAFSTFEQARAVAASLNDILKSRPAVDKLADAVNGDPTLKNLKNVLSSFPMDPDPDVWKAVIFSKRFYSNQKGSDEERADPDKKAFRPDKQGQVDMSGYNYETRPGGPYTNYDYGWYDETTNTWWHANHCQPFTDTAGGEHHQDCKPGMKVYQSSLEHYSRPLSDFDRQVFVVAFARKLQ